MNTMVLFLGGDSVSSASIFEEPHRDPDGFKMSPKGYRILSLDGGGIRGLVLCQALRALERAADKPIRDLFDWIIGGSFCLQLCTTEAWLIIV